MVRKKLWFFILIPICVIILLLCLYFTKNKSIKWAPELSSLILIIFILLFTVFFVFYYFYISYFKEQKSEKETDINFLNDSKWRSIKIILIGFLADFLDTIGVGSYAITIVALKISKEKFNHKKIFGILATGHAIPTLIEAILFISTIKVQILTLVVLIAAAAIGNFIGSYFANKIKLNWVQLIVGVTLALVALLILLSQKQVNVFTFNNTKNSLEVWWKYLTAGLTFVILGFLMAFGVGIYAPAMATVYLFGLNIIDSFPIMTGAAALGMPSGALGFVKDRNYDKYISTRISFGGSFGVIISYIFFFVFIQGFLGIDHTVFENILNWIIIFVILYTSILYFYTYFNEKKEKSRLTATNKKIVN